jgi:hypothetical protein
MFLYTSSVSEPYLSRISPPQDPVDKPEGSPQPEGSCGEPVVCGESVTFVHLTSFYSISEIKTRVNRAFGNRWYNDQHIKIAILTVLYYVPAW